MRDLSTIRDSWDAIEAEETRLLREMSVAEGLRAFSILYDAFGLRFRPEEETYLAEREAALIERQRRLARLAEWLKTQSHEPTLSFRQSTSKASG